METQLTPKLLRTAHRQNARTYFSENLTMVAKYLPGRDAFDRSGTWYVQNIDKDGASVFGSLRETGHELADALVAMIGA